uniref:Uncharacterized protein n=1 Tax=Romanomermis culicivorax TaxID=13658 RepID=A0A915L693_ROMCU
MYKIGDNRQLSPTIGDCRQQWLTVSDKNSMIFSLTTGESDARWNTNIKQNRCVLRWKYAILRWKWKRPHQTCDGKVPSDAYNMGRQALTHDYSRKLKKYTKYIS